MSKVAIDYNSISLVEGWDTSHARPVAMGGLSRTALNRELAKGLDSLNIGNTMTPDEVDAALAREFLR